MELAEAEKSPEFGEKQGQISTETRETSANTFANSFTGLLTHIEGVLASREKSANTVSNTVSKDQEAVSKPEDVVSKIRWYQNKAGAIIILPRGSDRKVLATISPKDGLLTHLYPSWERVLAELEALKAEKGAKRLSHDGLLTGSIPVANTVSKTVSNNQETVSKE